MRFQIALLCTFLACLATSNLIEAKNVYRRADKISEHFKQINLAEDEIDPNVAPEPPKIEHVETEDVEDITGTAQPEDEIIDEAALEALNNADTSANEIISSNGNEVEPVAAPAAAVVPTAAPVSSTSPAISSTTPVKNEDDPSAISKYCKCSDTHCDCCRTFGLPLIPIRGPGCAKITYLGDEKMSVSIKYGDVTLATRTISGKKAKPICVGLPGGYSKFCGRVYGLSKSKENFKACLGFELRAEDEIEAALRVSCFKFGPEGLRVADAEPLPSEVNKGEDDDDDDIFGFGEKINKCCKHTSLIFNFDCLQLQQQSKSGVQATSATMPTFV
ncbi:uncharacterized protein LOC119667219 [Teleopsis dalmanni]|uniref:uncharacterized protein LOC119667219 n=1 Tax=Teleopsis dalmanni TaxID=139649 RepID=UPI0018CEE1BA|nr:uncharacterized protein LOC119667219 [Teleopsis dalmanni]